MATVIQEKPGYALAESPQISGKRAVAFFACLFVLEWFMYFRHAGHFFQADAVFLLYHRATSIQEYLSEFIRLHSSGWYRPLSNDLVESILFPFVGLKPVAYRIPVYAFFIANTIAAYSLAFTITRRELVAGIATFYLAVHTASAFVTFDVSLLPDLMYTFFYLCSVLTYLRYLQHGTRAAQGASLAFFAASLCSKEAAVTLPGVLIVVDVLLSTRAESFVRTVLMAFRRALGHIVVLAVYGVLIVGYLNVQNVTLITSMKRPVDSPGGGYELFFDETLLENADLAMSWAFNVPRAYMGQWREPTEGMLTFLKFFRATFVLLLVVLLLRSERKKALLGIAWFFVAMSPMLPLFNHLLPNYLFLPLAGFSVVVGMAFAQLYDALRKLQPSIAAAALILLFGGLFYVCNDGNQKDISKNRLLGGSSEIALGSLNELKRLYPVLPPGAILYFKDNENPLSWEHTNGGLIAMAYNTKDVSARYSSVGDVLGLDEESYEKTIVLRFHDQRLIDETAEYRADPFIYTIQYQDSAINVMSLTPNEVTSGDSFKISISGVHDVPARITYTIDNGKVEVFGVRLDNKGTSTQVVTPATRKGFYQFLGFSIDGKPEWIRSSAVIRVH